MIGARRVVVTAGGELAEMARADKVPVIPLAGGYQPRAAVAYLTVAVLEVAALAGVGPRMNSEIDVAADHLEELVIEWGPDGVDAGEAKSLARALNGTVPMIAGAGLTTAIAYRWKTQINENAKSPAYAQELPELDHNEIEGWTSLGEFGRFSAVFLDDDDTHPRVKERMELDEPAHPAGRGRRAPRALAGPHDGRARVLARAARRPRLALPGRAARGRSRACRVALRAEGRARPSGRGARTRLIRPCGAGEGRPPMNRILKLPITVPLRILALELRIARGVAEIALGVAQELADTAPWNQQRARRARGEPGG